jgi:hypothetical protein
MRRFRLGAAVRAFGAGVIGAGVGYLVATLGLSNPNAGVAGTVIGAAVGIALAVLERALELYSQRGQTRLYPNEEPSNDLKRL